jgi:hypothetical protein
MAADVPDEQARDARPGLVGRDLRGGEELLRDPGERAAEADRHGGSRVDVIVPDLLARPAPHVERVGDVVVALLPALRARVGLALRQPDLLQGAHARQVEDADALSQMVMADEDPLAAAARPAEHVDLAVDHRAARDAPVGDPDAPPPLPRLHELREHLARVRGTFFRELLGRCRAGREPLRPDDELPERILELVAERVS